MSFFDYLNIPKVFIVAIYEKVTEKANQAGITVKTYLHDEKNIEHISLVVYDLLPLTLKLGLRYEKFHDKFLHYFKKLRNELFLYDENKNEEKTEIKLDKLEKHKTVVSIKKPRVKKTVETLPNLDKKVITKKTIKSPVITKPVKAVEKKKLIPKKKTIKAIEESNKLSK